ncbi:uncharacterized beta-barrel protein YwiB (DUF1934 family) [Paenibacillus taihuensis]|uniref:Uncharacterized beta-barrel protein YwiB (DUF1934 family) n=1 Tax=Paenibacillus taihuensis TaxID=1156355 RepID=A0A3D9QBS6_9BACL|nr:DUF1934 domain-containing protein [Paenibacillus taihuensis]REE57407.1 uncharacterized beta-barrel protein YwiB (DUF1934 family) [Paenibacillus taihuensis]
MTDRAKVTITLESDVDGEREQNTFSGEWFRKGSTMFIRYEETVQGPSGENAEVRTMIRWRDGELSLSRNGAVESQQIFVAGVRRTGHYASMHANFHMETETKLLWMQFGDFSEALQGQEQEQEQQQQQQSQPAIDPSDRLVPSLPMLLEWHYTLLVNDEPTGEFMIRLRAEEETGA